MMLARARLRVLCLAMLAALVAALAPAASGQTAGVAALIGSPDEFDGKEVTIEGEVVGDLMIRGVHAWLNVLDSGVAIGAWVPVDRVRDISFTGCYRSQGDRVRIVGTFRRVCPEHGGDMDIHARSCEKISSGAGRERGLDREKKKLVLRLSGIVVLLWIFSQLKIR